MKRGIKMDFKGILLVIACIFAYCQTHDVEAALNPKKPGVLQEATADLQQADESVETMVEYIIYAIYLGAIVTMAIGLLMLLRGLGKPDTGWGMLKSGFLVGLAGGSFHILLGMYNQMV